MLIRRGAFRLGYQQVTPHLKLLGEEAPHPKLGICTAIPIFLFCLCTNSKFSMSRRPSVKEKDDEKKSDDKETSEKCNKKLSYRRGPRDASCQLKSCQLPRNSAETTYTTSPDQIDGMKLEI